MAITTTRALPAQFIEDLGRDYGKQISALTSLPMDTSKFAPTSKHTQHLSLIHI